jgi:hypothetical protein
MQEVLTRYVIGINAVQITLENVSHWTPVGVGWCTHPQMIQNL